MKTKNYNDTVIKVLNINHGFEVHKAWTSIGVSCDSWSFDNTESEHSNTYYYYGLIDNIFDNYSLETVNKFNAKIVTIEELLSSIEELPEELPLPRKVLVWDYDFNDPTLMYLLHINKIGNPISPYICANIDSIDNNTTYNITSWKYMK